MPVTAAETANHLRRRQARRLTTDATRIQDVRAKLVDVSAMLRDEYGVGRVVLFGSFARGDIHDESDVDLAIDRELGVDYFSIVGRCSAMLGYDVHLLEMPKAPPSLLARLAAEGIVV